LKISVIVPVYNGEKYLDNCLNTLLNQTYKPYEIIFINDGSKDKSLSKIKEIEKKYKGLVKISTHDNKGLAYTRNKAVDMVTGDYIFFLDVDDTLHKNTFKILNKNKGYDLVKFSYAYVYDDGKKEDIITEYKGKVINGEEALIELIKSKQVFEMAPIYLYKTDFYKKNKFKFKVGRFHEDFGLIPVVILKSKKVKLLDDVLYYYYQTDDSVTRNSDYEKTVKNAGYVFDFYIDNKKIIEKEKISEINKKIILSFMANAVIGKIKDLKGTELKEYKKRIKEYKVVGDLLDGSLKRKLKKISIKLKMMI
jgi:Glycosyltransferases involved in cell wall biogenesis